MQLIKTFAMNGFHLHIDNLKKQSGGGGGKAGLLNSQLKSFKVKSPLQITAKALEEEIAAVNCHRSVEGTWRKQPEKCSSMEQAYELVQLPWILRQAVRIVKNLEIRESEEFFETRLKAGVMDIVERYAWSGDVCIHPRRDKRSGHHSGLVERTVEGYPCIFLSWGEPYAGSGSDIFKLSEDGNTLEQLSTMKLITGEETQYVTVFHRVQ